MLIAFSRIRTSKESTTQGTSSIVLREEENNEDYSQI